MRMLLIALALAAPAHADISDKVSVAGCDFSDMSRSWILCDITNHTEHSIASVSVQHIYTEPGRTIPWVDTRDSDLPYGTGDIAGGIEPGETINHIVRTPGLSNRADPKAVEFAITPIKAVTANGDVLE
ncbi:hypothetical protein [Sulfitobacter faviae]|uniref:hypothetical protein n=1 Tax=Sulfitobacter faviae TaxID=1775881 RepID=UPI00398D616E